MCKIAHDGGPIFVSVRDGCFIDPSVFTLPLRHPDRALPRSIRLQKRFRFEMVRGGRIALVDRR